MSFLNILIYGLLAGAASICGIYLVLFKEDWARRNSLYLISLSAGVLLAVASSDLLPEAISLSTASKALMWFLASFVCFYILEHSIILHACQESGQCEAHPIDRIALFGLSFHSLLDGLIIGASFEVSFALGFVATLSVILHKMPDGISISSILLHSNYTRARALGFSWMVALITPLGAVASYFLFQNISNGFLGAMLAIAAGSFFYVSAADLIPEIHKKSHLANIFLVVLGIVFIYTVGYLLS